MAGDFVDMDKQLSEYDAPYYDYDYADPPTSLISNENTIDLGYNVDGSKKYSFQTIYGDNELIKIAKEFYEERDGTEFE